jgi:hypothetical protein
MIMSVEELRRHVDTAMDDQALEALLQALELSVQGHTNNSFHKYKDEDGVINYPADVKMGVVNLVKWEMKNRSKVGVESESISRHSVTYYKMDKDNTELSYPASMLGFLKPYKKARFGQGLSADE